MLPKALNQVLTAAAALLCALPAAAQIMQLSVSVPGPGAASYLPVALISKIGADRAEGAQVKVNYVAGGGIAAQEMLTGNTEFAVFGLPAAMTSRIKDSRVVALAAINDLPLYVLLVRSGLQGKVKSVADLKGRVIGVHTSSITTKTNSHIVVDLMLRNAGVPLDSVRFVSIGQRWSSEAGMLADGTVDVIMGDEPYAARMVAEKTAFALVHLGDPIAAAGIPGAGFLRGALIGRKDKIDQGPKKAETMVRIIRRALEWIASHTPEEVVDMAGIEDLQERKYMLATLRKYPRQYSRDGKFSTRQLQDTEVFFRESQQSNSAAQALKVESMVIDRWAGRKD